MSNGNIIVFFDLETSGLKETSEIIQIAAVAVRSTDFTVLEPRFHRRVFFDEENAEPRALEINHYDKALWDETATSIYTALRDFYDWLTNNRFKTVAMTSARGGRYWIAQLAGYNSQEFDAKRLRAAHENAGLFYPAHYRTLDVMQMAGWSFVGLPDQPTSLKLTDVCDFLHIPVGNAHDAKADVDLTVEVARKLMPTPQLD
ncbi:MAG TPA: 3'-5' exonuclease [Nitrospiraceae bacterium]